MKSFAIAGKDIEPHILSVLGKAHHDFLRPVRRKWPHPCDVCEAEGIAFQCHSGRRGRHLEISDSRKNLSSPDLMVFEEKLLSAEERYEFRLGQRRNIAVNERMQLGRTKPGISLIGRRSFRYPIRFASKRIGRQRDAPVSLALMYRHQVDVVVL